MKDSRDILLSYIPIANFLVAMNGPRAEALIHDISDLNHSIIYVTPQNITGRNVGGTLTDFAIKLINMKVYEHSDYMVNYIGRSSYEEIILRSSTYFIKDEGQLIGLLCVNVDISEQVRSIETLEKSMLVDITRRDSSMSAEIFSLSADEIIHKIVSKKIGNNNGDKLTITKKHEIIAECLAYDVFLTKGAVTTVAALLNVSEPTVYRYIKEQTKDKGRCV